MRISKIKYPVYQEPKTRKLITPNWRKEFFPKLRLWAVEKFTNKFIFVQRLRIALYRLNIKRKHRIIRGLKRQMIRKLSRQELQNRTIRSKKVWVGNGSIS